MILNGQTIHELMERKVGFRVLTGQGANIDTTTASGRLVFGIFAALAEFEGADPQERSEGFHRRGRAVAMSTLHDDAGQAPSGASRDGRP